MALFFVPFCALFAILGVDCYTRFIDDRIITNRYFGIGETVRTYGQITRIEQVLRYKAPNGNIIDSPYYTAYFNDGSTWTTSHDLLRITENKRDEGLKEAELMVFVASKAGEQIEVFEFADR